MTRLILMRHAKAAAADGMQDHGRPLTARGLRDAARAGGVITREGWRPTRALVSDAVRTRQTLEAMAGALDPVPPLVLDPDLYAAPLAVILARVAATPASIGCLLVIGHNPGIGEAALRLATSGPATDIARLGQGFPTATLAVLSLPGGWAAAEVGGRLDALVLAG